MPLMTDVLGAADVEIDFFQTSKLLAFADKSRRDTNGEQKFKLSP